MSKEFAGHNLDDVFKEEEAKKKDVNHGPEMATSAMVPYPSKGIEFESQRVFSKNKLDRGLYFDESLERLRADGYERHAQPREVFDLIMNNLEGRVSPGSGLANTCADMTKGSSSDGGNKNTEWLSVAFERRDSLTLAVYIDPKNLVWDGHGYTVKEKYLECYEWKDFSLKGLSDYVPHNGWHELKRFPDDFVQFITGRSFDELPEELREGGKRVQLCIPSSNRIIPVGLMGYSLAPGGYGAFMRQGSRGVRKTGGSQ